MFSIRVARRQLEEPIKIPRPKRLTEAKKKRQDQQRAQHAAQRNDAPAPPTPPSASHSVEVQAAVRRMFDAATPPRTRNTGG